MGKRVSVTNQDKNGRNTSFRDNQTHKQMTRSQFVQKIKQGKYPNYEVRKINGIDTPVSKPDSTTNNNLD
ncbi:hypothetical protein LDJ81_03350 [Lentilactobacillus parabuchneri]|uniref:DUF3892 domain-containing protein n=1 Tax=Lentilactobacillus parabuchneri TaxID=152331 RepID=UPI002236414C|nr:hypothetical protein [Lentilactobacillus parabuchneri]MCW4398067.1 hypothetical protein [Lentilactobacillus parabuchneri]